MDLQSQRTSRGAIDYSISFSLQDLFPSSLSGTLTYIGVLEFSLEFIFFVFPLYVLNSSAHEKE